MIRFRYDDKSDVEQGNKNDAQDKVKNWLTEELILAIIAFSFSMSAVRSGYQDKVDQMFAEIKAARTAETTRISR
jgi:hypothetical protein